MSTLDRYSDHSAEIAKRRLYDNDGTIHFKEEPDYNEHLLFDSPVAQHAFTQNYHAGGTYTEQELAESLGWSQYSGSGQGYNPAAVPSAGMPQDMHLQNITAQSQRSMMPLIRTNSGPTTIANYGSVAIPQHSGSPAGWHSSLDSPGFMGDSGSGTRPFSLGHLSNQVNRKEGTSVAEKKAMRRYSHNAVERRRRDNINEQIQELAALVPTAMLGNGMATQSPKPESSTSIAAQKPNKGIVLRKSVEYIQLLKALVDEKSEREKLMGMIQHSSLMIEIEIRRLGGNIPPEKKSMPSSSSWLDDFAIVEDDD